MSEKELLLIIRDLLGFGLHGPGLFRLRLEEDLKKIEEALHELEHDAS